MGGLVGENEYTGAITDSFATGTVNGSNRDAGGLVGCNAVLGDRETVGTIIRSYATGPVSGNGNVGGLVGWNDGKIKASYATGTVNGNRFVGSLVGHTWYAPIKTSYAAGTARERYARGVHLRGLVGKTSGTISGSYYDSEVSGRTGNNGKTTAELTAPTGYTGIYAGWNLDLDNSDEDDNESTGGDDPWDFGTSQQYPALKADFNGDGTATWQEFGYQARERPTLAARAAGPRVFLRWNPVDASDWTNPPRIAYALYRNGKKVDGYDGSTPAYTDTGLNGRADLHVSGGDAAQRC